MSFKIEFAGEENADDSSGWAGNGQRFASSREATAAAVELRDRVSWFKSHRVVEADDPVNYLFDFVSNLATSLPEPIWVPGVPAEVAPEPAPEPGTVISDVPPPVANVVPPVPVEAIHAEPEATAEVAAPVQVEAPVEPEPVADIPAPEPVVPDDTTHTAS